MKSTCLLPYILCLKTRKLTGACVGVEIIIEVSHVVVTHIHTKYIVVLLVNSIIKEGRTFPFSNRL